MTCWNISKTWAYSRPFARRPFRMGRSRVTAPAGARWGHAAAVDSPPFGRAPRFHPQKCTSCYFQIRKNTIETTPSQVKRGAGERFLSQRTRTVWGCPPNCDPENQMERVKTDAHPRSHGKCVGYHPTHLTDKPPPTCNVAGRAPWQTAGGCCRRGPSPAADTPAGTSEGGLCPSNYLPTPQHRAALLPSRQHCTRLQ